MIKNCRGRYLYETFRAITDPVIREFSEKYLPKQQTKRQTLDFHNYFLNTAEELLEFCHDLWEINF